MAKVTDAWGIEVGANAIKAVHLASGPDGVRLLEYEVLPFKNILTMPDINVEEEIRLGLDQFLAKHDVKKSAVIISIAGNQAFARFAKLPPVEPKKIPDIVKFEAQQQIPYPIEQVEWDYQVFAQPDSPDVEVGIFAVTKDKVTSLLANYQAVGIPVQGLTLSPLAVYNAFAFDMGLNQDSDGLIVMDIGTSNTDIIVADHGDLWLRTVPIGGNHFTDALVRAFKLSLPKAEKLKREAATSKHARQIFQAMRPVFSDLVQEVQRSLGFYQSQNRDAKFSKMLGIGSTFRLPGLQKFLKQQLQLEVSRPDGFQKINVEGALSADFSENTINLATAYGLALQGLGLEQIGANVLPRSVMRQRLWQKKQPVFLAAAACVVVAAAGSWGKYWAEENAFANAVNEHQSEVTKWLGLAKQNNAKVSEIITQNNGQVMLDNIRRAFLYRELFPQILGDISEATHTISGGLQSSFEGDYQKIKNIARRDRKQFFIETIEISYGGATISGNTASGGGLGGSGGGGPRWDASTGSFGPGGPSPGAGPAGPGMPIGPGGIPAAEVLPPEQPRTCTVHLTGWTPYKEGPKLGDEFLKWLRDHAERSNRAYKFVIEASPMQIRQRGAGASAGTPGGSGPGWSPGPMGAPGMTPDGGMVIELPPEVRSLYPIRPLSEENTGDDWVFDVSFKVEILPPDKVPSLLSPSNTNTTTSPTNTVSQNMYQLPIDHSPLPIDRVAYRRETSGIEIMSGAADANDSCSKVMENMQ